MRAFKGQDKSQQLVFLVLADNGYTKIYVAPFFDKMKFFHSQTLSKEPPFTHISIIELGKQNKN